VKECVGYDDYSTGKWQLVKTITDNNAANKNLGKLNGIYRFDIAHCQSATSRSSFTAKLDGTYDVTIYNSPCNDGSSFYMNGTGFGVGTSGYGGIATPDVAVADIKNDGSSLSPKYYTLTVYKYQE
jgi:hypothetical protein